MNIKHAIATYQKALERDLELAQQETSIKEQRTAAHRDVSAAMADLLDLQHEIRSMRPVIEPKA